MNFKKILVLSILSSLQITIKAENIWPTTEIWGKPDLNKYILKNQERSFKTTSSRSITYPQPRPSFNKIPSPSDTPIWGRPNSFIDSSQTTYPLKASQSQFFKYNQSTDSAEKIKNLIKHLDTLENLSQKNIFLLEKTKDIFDETENTDLKQDLKTKLQNLEELTDGNTQLLNETKKLFNETENLLDNLPISTNSDQIENITEFEDDLEQELQKLELSSHENEKLLDEIKELVDEIENSNEIQDNTQLKDDLKQQLQHSEELADGNTKLLSETKNLFEETKNLLDNSNKEPIITNTRSSIFDTISQKSTKHTLSKIFKDCAIYDLSENFDFPGIFTIVDLWDNTVNPAKRSVQISSSKIKEMWNSLNPDNQQELIDQWRDYKIRDYEIHKTFPKFRKSPK